jgi:hypothetical protein
LDSLAPALALPLFVLFLFLVAMFISFRGIELLGPTDSVPL